MSSVPVRQMPATNRAPGIIRKIASMMYELILLTGVLAGAVVLPHTLYGVIMKHSAASWLLWLHVLAVLATYFVWFWTHGGQTLAMKTWKIRLIDASSGNTIGIISALLRFVLCTLSIVLFGTGFLWALFDRKKQFLHDRLAGTCLVLVSDAPPIRSSVLQPAGK